MNSHKLAYKWIAPYFIFGALSFVAACVILFFLKTEDFHFAHPLVIASVHCITLGWACMLIFGAGHQLLPVLFNTGLYSHTLLLINLVSAMVGIPLLIAGMSRFNMGGTTILGAGLITVSALSFAFNTFMTAMKAKDGKIQALYLCTGSVYLFITVLLGFLQVVNFRFFILPFDSFRLLNIHAHSGLIGFISMFVVGVSSRLIPMFSLSKYENKKLLLALYLCMQAALVSYILFDLGIDDMRYLYPTGFSAGILLFIYYTANILKHRMKKQLDAPLKSSFRFQFLMIPIIVLALVSGRFLEHLNTVKMLYGCTWLYGAISSILIGMSFKTLPFMAWSSKGSAGGKAMPKDLFNATVFKFCSAFQLLGFIALVGGLIGGSDLWLTGARILMSGSAALYLFLILQIHRYSL